MCEAMACVKALLRSILSSLFDWLHGKAEELIIEEILSQTLHVVSGKRGRPLSFHLNYLIGVNEFSIIQARGRIKSRFVRNGAGQTRPSEVYKLQQLQHVV